MKPEDLPTLIQQPCRRIGSKPLHPAAGSVSARYGKMPPRLGTTDKIGSRPPGTECFPIAPGCRGVILLVKAIRIHKLLHSNYVKAVKLLPTHTPWSVT